MVGSKDMSTWVFGAERWANLIYYSLGGHKDVVVGCFFEKDSLDVRRHRRFVDKNHNFTLKKQKKLLVCSSTPSARTGRCASGRATPTWMAWF